ncbi:MAG: hypothetical protein R2880_19700 [Deinococcales bacterium]
MSTKQDTLASVESRPRYTTRLLTIGYRDGEASLGHGHVLCKATHDRDNAAINILARFVPLSTDMSQEAVGSEAPSRVG